MAWIYLPAQVSGVSPLSIQSRIIEQCVMSNGNRTAKLKSFLVSLMESWTMPQYGMTLDHSTAINGVAKWILSLADSHASHSLSLENGRGKPMSAICGLTPSESLAKYDPDMRCWKTYQGCLFTNTLDEFSETWPKAGMMLNGYLYPLPKSARPTDGNGNGYWPTPSAQVAGEGPLLDTLITKTGKFAQQGEGAYNPETGKHVQITLNRAVKMFPTPSVTGNYNRKGLSKTSGNGLATVVKMFPTPKGRDWKGQTQRGLHRQADGLPNQDRGDGKCIGGQLNPMWVEWLMDWPSGWTDLRPLGMDGFQVWLDQFCR